MTCVLRVCWPQVVNSKRQLRRPCIVDYWTLSSPSTDCWAPHGQHSGPDPSRAESPGEVIVRLTRCLYHSVSVSLKFVVVRFMYERLNLLHMAFQRHCSFTLHALVTSTPYFHYGVCGSSSPGDGVAATHLRVFISTPNPAVQACRLLFVRRASYMIYTCSNWTN